MALPQPHVPFVDVCAAIWNNTLFAYQSNAFQSLSLTPGSTWNTLAPGATVNASSCVVGQVDGKDALWVIGGAGADPDSMFPGYQQYLFEEAVWASPLPTVSQFVNRIGHGIAWLNDSNSVLVYGGATSAQGSGYSSAQTFTIGANSPYVVKTYSAPSGLPAAMDPLMFSWNSSSAGFVGGSTGNSQAWIFSPNASWQLEAYLSTVPGGYLSTQAALVTTADGTKTLQLFDFAAVPNNILNQVLQSASYGLEPGQANASPGAGHNVLLTNLPTYNASLAPTVSRSGASLAQATSGLVAIVGGSDSSNPFVLFNQADNGWVDAQSFFAATSTSASSSSATSASSTSATVASSTSIPSSAATATQPAFVSSIPEPSESSAPSPNRGTILAQVIGGIVGGVVGAVILLTLIFICFRSMYRKRKLREAQRDGASSPTVYDKDNKAMVDPMTRPAWNISKPTLQPFNASNTNATAPPTDTVVAAAVPRRAGKDQGWSSYFNSSEANAIASKANSGRESEISQSEYEGGSRITSTLPGLVGRRDSNGLTMLHDPSNATNSHGHRDEDDFLEADSTSNVDSWGPLGPSDGSSGWNRPSSSMYGEKNTGDNAIPLARIQNGAQRTVTTNAGNGMLAPPGNAERGLRTMMTREFAMPSAGLRPGIDRTRGTELSSLAPSSLDVETGSRTTTSLQPGQVVMGRNGNSHVGKEVKQGSADLSWLDLGQR